MVDVGTSRPGGELIHAKHPEEMLRHGNRGLELGWAHLGTRKGSLTVLLHHGGCREWVDVPWNLRCGQRQRQGVPILRQGQQAILGSHGQQERGPIGETLEKQVPTYVRVE